MIQNEGRAILKTLSLTSYPGLKSKIVFFWGDYTSDSWLW